jgi:hypothetical protein
MQFERKGGALRDISERYSANFSADLIVYGQKFAKAVIDDRHYHIFDPVVSDHSCQLRAVWLAEYCRFHTSSKDLSDEDLLFFGLSRFLYESADFLDSDITGRVPGGSNVKLWPDALQKIESRTQQKRFFGVAKSIIQTRILKDFSVLFSEIADRDIQVHGLFKVSPAQVRCEILSLLAQAPQFSFSTVKIPMFHFFPGLIIVGSLPAAHNFPIEMIIRKIKDGPGGTLVCCGTTSLYFMYDASSGIFTQVSHDQVRTDCPAVSFLSYAYGKQSERVDGGDFVANLNESFGVNASLLDYIYAISATHTMLVGADEGFSTIENAPVLTALAQQYFDFAHKISLVAHRTDKYLQREELADIPFVITHVYGRRATCSDLYWSA